MTAEISQSQLERRILRALFDYIQDNSNRLGAEEVAGLLEGEFSPARVHMALRTLERNELVRGAHNAYSGSSYEISESGYLEIEEERNIARVPVETESDQPSEAEPEEILLPASDRMVPLNHNSPEYAEVKERLVEVREIVRGANDLDIDPAERDAVVNALFAAEALWQSTQLKYIQLKIGVLMAAQDAWRILKKSSQAIAAALLVDAVKAFIKTHAGVDLDNL